MSNTSSVIKDDLEELLFISKFMLNKKKFKEERKNLKKMIKKIDNNEFEDLILDGDDYDGENV